MAESFDVYYVPNIDEMDHEEAVAIALRWLQASVAKKGGVPIVITPTRDQLRYSYLAPNLSICKHFANQLVSSGLNRAGLRGTKRPPSDTKRALLAGPRAVWEGVFRS